jgi:hypothetical protein
MGILNLENEPESECSYVFQEFVRDDFYTTILINMGI